MFAEITSPSAWRSLILFRLRVNWVRFTNGESIEMSEFKNPTFIRLRLSKCIKLLIGVKLLIGIGFSIVSLDNVRIVRPVACSKPVRSVIPRAVLIVKVRRPCTLVSGIGAPGERPNFLRTSTAKFASGKFTFWAEASKFQQPKMTVKITKIYRYLCGQ